MCILLPNLRGVFIVSLVTFAQYGKVKIEKVGLVLIALHYTVLKACSELMFIYCYLDIGCCVGLRINDPLEDSLFISCILAEM